MSFFRRSKKTPRTPPHQSEYYSSELYHQEPYFYPLGDQGTSSQFPASPNLSESGKRAREPSTSPPEDEKIIQEEKRLQRESVNMELTLDQKVDEILKIVKGELFKRTNDNSTACEMLLRTHKEKNVIVLGIDEKVKNATEKEVMHKTVEELCEKMGIKPVIDYDFARRLGKFQDGKARPVLIRFVRIRDKIAFLSSRNKLKGSKIKLRSDDTRQQREMKKNNAHIYEEEWKKDKNTRRFYRGNKMFLTNNGIITKVVDMTSSPQPI